MFRLFESLLGDKGVLLEPVEQLRVAGADDRNLRKVNVAVDETRHDERVVSVTLDLGARWEHSAHLGRGTHLRDPPLFDRDDCVGLVAHGLAKSVLKRVADKGDQRAADRARRRGCTFEGEKGTIFVDRKKIVVNPPELAKHTGGVKLPVSNNHHQNFLDCVKSRERPIADVEIGHRSATVCHLGNIAVRTGKKLTWDPAKEEFVGDAETAKWVSKEYRQPWTLG